MPILAIMKCISKIRRGNIRNANQMDNLYLTIILIETLKVKNKKLLHVSIPVGLSSGSTSNRYVQNTMQNYS
jgi:hypothetical protein